MVTSYWQWNQQASSQTGIFKMLSSAEGSSAAEWGSVAFLIWIANTTWQNQLSPIMNKSGNCEAVYFVYICMWRYKLTLCVTPSVSTLLRRQTCFIMLFDA
jgi:hypothetical protein